MVVAKIVATIEMQRSDNWRAAKHSKYERSQRRQDAGLQGKGKNMKRDFIKVLNRLFLDAILLPSAKRVAVTLFAYKNTKNACRKSVCTIWAGAASRSTALKALTEFKER